MKRRIVEISDDAIADLNGFYHWIGNKAEPAIALSYIERLKNYCRGFDVASERVELRDDIRLGLRIVGRVTIAFTVEERRDRYRDQSHQGHRQLAHGNSRIRQTQECSEFFARYPSLQLHQRTRRN